MKRQGKVVRYIGTADVYYIDEKDWRNNQSISDDKGVPARLVWYSRNGWTIPVRQPDGELLAEGIMEYFETAPEFVVVDEGDTVHVPFIRAKLGAVQQPNIALGRAIEDDTDPAQAARVLSRETPIVHTGPADVEGVTDTRDQAPPTGRIPHNEADPGDATAAQGAGLASGVRSSGQASPTTTTGGSTAGDTGPGTSGTGSTRRSGTGKSTSGD